MAKNNLTPEQDLITRAFFQEVLSDDRLFADTSVGRNKARALCLNLLNYAMIHGKFVEFKRASKLTHSLGRQPEAECEWNEDTKRTVKEFTRASASGEDSSKANSSKSPEGAALWKAIFPKDV